MTVPALVPVPLAGRPGLPLLLCGPSLGTSVTALWSTAADLLGDRFQVVGWELPGHGTGSPVADPFTVAELATGVLLLADSLSAGPFHYAGDSLGGVVGLQLLLDHPQRLQSATLLCTGAKIATSAAWAERAALVRDLGTGALVEQSAAVWFGPGFADRQPEVSGSLLRALSDTDAVSYAFACEALADFDVRDRLREIGTPVLALAGATDERTPAASLAEIADGVRHGRLEVLHGVGHLAPAEAPAEVAALIAAHAASSLTAGEVRGAGMQVRREVLGDAHVDRAVAATTGLTRDFQDLITQYAWGSVWTRPGLDRRSRSMITLTALVAGGHHDELAMHLRAARRNGLSDAEIAEVLLQSAIYCGVPAANSAFRIAQQVLGEEEAR